MTLEIEDTFPGRALPRWVRFATGYGRLDYGPQSLRCITQDARSSGLSDAQITDYRGVSSQDWPWSPPVTLEVRARMSHPAESLLGTAGFGFWNDPFTLGGKTTVAPNNVWFFFASPPSDMRLVTGVPGCGWKAAVLNSGNPPGWMIRLGEWVLRTPGLRRLAQQAARVQVHAAESLLNAVSLTEWHTYRLRWTKDEAQFWVDDREVLRATNPPTVPLGFVAWIDNQWARFTPEGEFSFGLLDIPHDQWLEMDYVRIGGA